MTHFHVTLPSDGSKDTYPANTISHYTTKLSERIELDGEYEVGLAEFMFPHTWFNFKNDDELYWISVKINARDSKFITFKSGYYADGAAFASDLNRQSSRATLEVVHVNAHIRFTFNPNTLKMTIDMSGRGWISVSDEFMKFLGFLEVGHQMVDRI
jgi:hypothetical protein